MMTKAVANQVIKIFHGQFTFLLKTPPLFCFFLSQNDIKM
ncbi:unnamed protein product [Brassica oleracea var. botrytis]